MDDGKSVKLDFTVVTSTDEKINIEVQVINNHDMPERILYYWAKTYASSITSGQPYTLLKPTIMISILNYPLFPSETNSFHTCFRITEDTEQFLWSNHLEFHVFDLSAFMLQWRKYRREIRNQEKNEQIPWLMMLSAADYRKRKFDEELIGELEEWAMDKEQVREALIEWETLSANKENRVLYEAKAKEMRDLLSNLEGERRLGKQEGRLEEKHMTALKMLEKGFDIGTIAEITELSEDEVNSLLNK
ncbi:Rpn family recombination-promoting nuclease/putative transposase [Fredinandcohnia sp. SECRCQ15]|uniref:Rpn family recombination-promoting nuclease/putative transposase n=1 Tax=Fredinandcohnia quinoae TaxID=2918902 RepID=A0AAW5E508_9BACI|nr:Rpn family recombination-promoting nuclease/putative transposase [Fredinandcohnia sp. SECRCQ15]